MTDPRLTDRTLALMRQGYLFADGLRRRVAASEDAAAVPLRLLGRPALMVRGAEGVQMFYDTAHLKRQGAVPKLIAGSLFGRGAVHGLDDQAHRHRKALFVNAVQPAKVEQLGAIAARRWGAAVDEWARVGEGQVHATAVEVFGGAVMEWAGVPCPDALGRRRSQDLAAIVDGFGVVGPAYLRARVARHRCDRWATDVIRKVRSGEVRAAETSALADVAGYRGLDGELLDAHVAGVELLNILRPTVAVAWFATFAALALHQHPEWRLKVSSESDAGGASESARVFAQEVRRVYPFVPMLAAKARNEFTWHGHRIEAGQRVVLDIFGTDREDRAWEAGTAFDPTRFMGTGTEDSDSFVPQGGGPVATGHRCPGEGIAVTLLTVTIQQLAALDWQVPPQDVQFSFRRMPTRPRSGMRLTGIRR